ncbi:hypothetical protein ACJIZ3_023973 [Penstemon smallii]|uniref:Transmembrane protein n=1 Tax=Penstemon smallii TaxID=265156 RepID=A0ABD3TRJ0_9LAMI
MDNSLKAGFMAVFAVSGSVVFLAMQAHNRLLSNFMKTMEFEIKHSTETVKDETKKKVKFADNVVEKAYSKKHSSPAAAAHCRNINDENLEAMPPNRQVMYKGILHYRKVTFRGLN